MLLGELTGEEGLVRQAILRLKRGREARARSHPWVFKGDVADVAAGGPGLATVVDSRGNFVGRGFYNPQPALCCRILTWKDEPVDARWLGRRVQAAVERRRPSRRPAAFERIDAAGSGRDGVPSLGRLVWSEADGLPGFIADRYGDVLVIQCLTLGMHERRAELARALRSAAGDLAVFSADESAPASLEGFEAVRGWLDRVGPGVAIVNEDSVKLEVTFGAGHKTGLYLDQRDNRLRVGPLAKHRDVLDVFCYTAGFACHALVAGARRARCIESSPEALGAAARNLARNGVADRAELVGTNAFDELRRLDRAQAKFGLIVLDPPPFARSRPAIEAAARGYKEINLRAMRLLAAGGVLATFSCSHHVSEPMFEEICREAAADAGATLTVLGRLGQSPDHPVLLTVPETRYLKGLLLERA